jgi:hypothetical protein
VVNRVGALGLISITIFEDIIKGDSGLRSHLFGAEHRLREVEVSGD